MKSNDKKPRRPRAVTEVARTDDRGLAAMLARAARLEQMDRSLADILDPRHAPHVRVMNVRDGKLLLATPVAPIATRLRMEAPKLLPELQRLFPGEFLSLEVVVTPDLPPRG
jgi:hypothetical protein